MTRYSVTWRKTAQNQLADLWTIGPERAAIAAAANSIDQELSNDPASKGYPVSPALRGLHVPPLQVLYSIREADRLVEVISVKRDPPESNGQALASNP